MHEGFVVRNGVVSSSGSSGAVGRIMSFVGGILGDVPSNTVPSEVLVGTADSNITVG